MIGFKDFVPGMKDRGGLFRRPEMEQLSESIREANEWISQNDVEVINIETVVLPNMYCPGEEGSTDVQLSTSGDMGSSWYQFVRVWYRA